LGEEASDFGQEPKKELKKKNPGGGERTLGVAALRELRDEKRRGNDAPWKAWKTQKPKASFPLFPPGLEIRQKPRARISTLPPRRRRTLSHSERTRHEAQTKFQLTDPGHFKHYNCASVASLRP
jgi:hypothetical protein